MTNSETNGSVVLPALRGSMGDWVYYCCLMDLPTLASRVRYARDLHKNEKLSKMIQRALEGKRSKEIAEYLKNQDERLFNALVVATYGGRPNWHALTEVQSKGDSGELRRLTNHTMLRVGFLTLRGDEKLFALDGQHRLSGIKRAVEEDASAGHTDEVPVMFVAHEKTERGLQKTRRLFTTLNKTAKPVSKFDIIALDEDDVMALTVRWLIDENSGMFGEDRIAFVGSSNMPSSNYTSLTTIVGLYDILKTWYTKANTPLKTTLSELRKSRPEDHRLESYFQLARELFEELRRGFPELDDFFSADDPEPIVRDYRNRNVLFRPVGLDIFVTIVARLTEDMDLGKAIDKVAKLPRSLESPPFVRLLWNPHTETIRRFAKSTLLELLLHMLGRSGRDKEELLRLYIKDVGDDTLELPKPVVSA